VYVHFTDVNGQLRNGCKRCRIGKQYLHTYIHMYVEAHTIQRFEPKQSKYVHEFHVLNNSNWPGR
jgi:hypothetical protein